MTTPGKNESGLFVWVAAEEKEGTRQFFSSKAHKKTMAEELAKVKDTLKRKPYHHNPLPRAVVYWLFFKCRILERPAVRAQFEREPALDVAGFRQLVKKLANPQKWGPSFCRGQRRGKSAKTAKRNTNDMLAVLWRYYEALLHPGSPICVAESETVGGLGVFARRQRSAAVKAEGDVLLESHLWGVVFEVNEEGFAQLQGCHYPSLYQGRHAYIMGGPLSLVNHECKAPLAFSLPRKVHPTCSLGGAVGAATGKNQPTLTSSSSSLSSSPSTAKPISPLACEEFAGLYAVYAQATVARYRVTPGQEIVVDSAASGGGGGGQRESKRRRKQPISSHENNDSSSSISFESGACQCRTCCQG